jgi:hypothetical protein
LFRWDERVDRGSAGFWKGAWMRQLCNRKTQNETNRATDSLLDTNYPISNSNRPSSITLRAFSIFPELAFYQRAPVYAGRTCFQSSILSIRLENYGILFFLRPTSILVKRRRIVLLWLCTWMYHQPTCMIFRDR